MSDVSRMLDETVDRLLQRALAASGAREDAALPDRLAEEAVSAGLHLAMVAEKDGGLGATLAEASTIAWRCGWHAAPLPIVEMLLLPTIDAEASPLSTALAHGSPASAPLLGKSRDVLLASGRVDANDDARHEGLAGSRRIRLEADAGWGDAVQARGALLTAAAMTGAMARVLEIATDYAGTRVQFGRPLTKFQSIQHRLAEAVSELALTEAALAAAMQAEAESRLRPLLWRSAKAQAGHAATVIAASAHQILGAIGFTEEHELHRFTFRLWQWRDEWGRQADCQIAIGREACADQRGLWPYIASEGSTAA